MDYGGALPSLNHTGSDHPFDCIFCCSLIHNSPYHKPAVIVDIPPVEKLKVACLRFYGHPQEIGLGSNHQLPACCHGLSRNNFPSGIGHCRTVCLLWKDSCPVVHEPCLTEECSGVQFHIESHLAYKLIRNRGVKINCNHN